MENDSEAAGEAPSSIEDVTKAYVASLAKPEPKGQTEKPASDEAEAEDELQEPEEGEGETDGELDEDGQAIDETDAEQESDGGRFVASNGKVKLPDGTVSTVADLIQGNLRDKDYRQKTMDVAETRKSFETQSSAVKQREQQLTEQATYMAKLIESIVPAAPDPSMLNTDPMGFIAQKEAREQWLAHLNYLNSQQQTTKAKADDAAKTDRKTKADKEWASLTEKRPEFKDEKRTRAFVDKSLAYGEANGFSRQEIAEALMMDHRQLLIVEKAMKWDQLQASKPKVQLKTEGKPAVLKAGKRQSPGEFKAREAADKRAIAKKTGSLDDVTAAYIASLNKG